MKYIPIILVLIISILFTGCASTNLEQIGLEERTMKIGNFGGVFVLYESSTKGLDATGVDIKKEE